MNDQKANNNPSHKGFPWIFRDNSLDLIRLIAAIQVLILHSFEYLTPELTDSVFLKIIQLIPGVPVFFFISGFLISRSYERKPSLSDYGRNRALRIFPALIVCVFINIVMVWSTGYFKDKGVSLFDLSALFLAKSTILQFYNPEFMRSFGDGVLNGSLWTICVELQFYFLTPFLYIASQKLRFPFDKMIVVLILIGIGANRLLYITYDSYSDYVLWKLYRVSFSPWLYMFLIGVLFQRNFNVISRVLSKIPALPFLFAYLIAMYAFSKSGLIFGNSIPPYVFLPLSLLIMRLAYSFTTVTKTLLKGNDFSYGLYIWHMPLVNQVLFLRSDPGAFDLAFVLLGSFILAWLSWMLIEKNAMKLKNVSLREQPRE